MTIKKVLLLGNPRLYTVSDPVRKDELADMRSVVADLHDTLMDFRQTYGAGRAIAAPQIGVMKRLLYMCIDGVSTVFINPHLKDKSEEMIEIWDDCMCFPDLLVKVRRHHACCIRSLNLDWKEERLVLEGGLSELLQHEYDHLDGILAVARAVDHQSFALRSQLRATE